ncbi:hypothetical protein [Helicobacter sp.]|uniref:hypothetical protein n=1 Tax=Helicobacter sp. TaxID=218 RepID=UPI0025C67D45|nr:hypothetical protein [Helicobacter sp.]MCI5633067.1 hypothetical protein [Helicobacter sp.]
MQDNRFSVELLYQAHKIYVLPKKLIYYRSCDCSTTNSTLEKDKNAPHFFDVGKELGENKKVAHGLFVALSNYVLKLHWQDFIAKHQNLYGITTISARLLQQFHNAYTQCLFLPYTNTEQHLRLCFNLLLHLNKNYKQFHPFANLNTALEIGETKNTNDEVAQFMLDILYLENGIVIQKNIFIKALQARIQELETQNSELLLENLQDE